MKRLFFFVLFFTSLAACMNEQSRVSNRSKKENTSELTEHINPIFLMHQDIDTFLLEDMNGDKINDTAIVFSPVHAYPHPDDFSSGGCEDDTCLTVVKFNFTKTELKHKTSLGFIDFFRTEDLDGDGINEVGFVPHWFQSCWQGLFVYSLSNNEWIQLASGSVFACSGEDFSERVKKVRKNKFQLISDRRDLEDDTLVEKSITHMIN